MESIGLEYIRLPSEEETLHEIMESPFFKFLASPDEQQATLDSRFRLQPASLVVHATAIRGIKSMVMSRLKKIGLAANQLEINVVPLPDYNAFTFSVIDEAFVLGVSSKIIDDFTSDEILFVLGHEIGHYLLGHTKSGLEIFNKVQEAEKTSHIYLKAQSLSRRREISCDRLGLICCGSLDAAVKATLKGLTQSQCKKLDIRSSDLFSGSGKPLPRFFDERIDGYAPWLQSHPSAQVRARALEAFAPLAQKISGYLNQELRDELAAVNEICEDLLDTMELDVLKKNQGTVERLYQYIFTLGQNLERSGGDHSRPGNELFKSFSGQGVIFPLPLCQTNRSIPLSEIFDFLNSEMTLGRRIRLFDFLVAIAIEEMVISPERRKLLLAYSRSLLLPEKVVSGRLQKIQSVLALLKP